MGTNRKDRCPPPGWNDEGILYEGQELSRLINYISVDFQPRLSKAKMAVE
jgi:hypothetical protein